MKDDVISRQAAIDALNALKKDGHAYVNGAFFETILRDEANRVLEELPSAQPEIIRCKDCRHRILNLHYGEKGYHNNNIKGFCELDTGDPYELGRDAQNDDWFCADAERRTDE